MKVFISQKMSGVPDDEIISTRDKAIETIKSLFGDDVEIVNTFADNIPVPKNTNPRLYRLGHAIQRLSEVDLIYFTFGYKQANGCLIEEEIAKLYIIPYIKETKFSNTKGFIYNLDPKNSIARTVIDINEIDIQKFKG